MEGGPRAERGSRNVQAAAGTQQLLRTRPRPSRLTFPRFHMAWGGF